MILFLALILGSLAGGPSDETWTPAQLEARMPSLADRGVGPLQPIEGETAWQAALEGGGFVRIWLRPDAEQARTLFAFQAQSAVTVPAPPLADAAFQEAAGDGKSLILARAGNAVVLVRDPRGQARELATVLLGL
jgi:hypothetical protein